MSTPSAAASEIGSPPYPRPDQLLSGITHDLRSPLFTICGYLELLQKQLRHSGQDKAMEYVRLAREAGQRLNQMVEEMLDVMRSGQGPLTMRMESVVLSQLFTRLWNNFHVRASEKKIQLRIILKGHQDMCVYGDARLLERALDNLLGNALKFTPAGGNVTVTGTNVSGRTLVEVADTGRGIPPEAQARLFDASVPVLPADRFTGFGLGLPIVKFIIEAHQGHIQVYSELGQGSRFLLSLLDQKPAT